MERPAIDPDKIVADWADVLARLLTAPESAFWWPGLVLAGLAALFWGRDRAIWGRGRDYLRHLPVDLACLTVNIGLPLLLAPWLFMLGMVGNKVGAALAVGFVGAPSLAIPGWPALLACATLAFVAGDFALYWTHRLFHAVPMLWRSHRLHHAPPVLTPLTAFRFWPWEQAVHLSSNMLAQGLAIGVFAGLFGATVAPLTLLGVNAVALSWGLLFTPLRHSPVPMPFPRWLSLILISPQMHQLHHSVADEHRDRNFGTALAVWDQWFGTLVVPDKDERFRFGVREP